MKGVWAATLGYTLEALAVSIIDSGASGVVIEI